MVAIRLCPTGGIQAVLRRLGSARASRAVFGALAEQLLSCWRCVYANAQSQRPDNRSHLLRIAPRAAQLINYLFQWIRACRGDEPLR